MEHKSQSTHTFGKCRQPARYHPAARCAQPTPWMVLLAGEFSACGSRAGDEYDYVACTGFVVSSGRRCALPVFDLQRISEADGRAHGRPANDRPHRGPGSMLGLYAVLSHGMYEVSAQSLTSGAIAAVERDRFLGFLRTHKEAQMRAVQCICQEYRFALQDACRIALRRRWRRGWRD